MDSNIEIFMKHSSMLLKVYGIERPKHEAAIIFKNILNKSYTNILTNNDLKIPIQKRNEILENLFERLKGKPLSKIFGKKEFYSREFYVSENTLDPRPDTELMIDVIKNLSKNFKKKNVNILDIGTGSGCIIITIFLELFSQFSIQASGFDISEEALSVAKKNSSKFSLKKKIHLFQSNWFDKLNGEYDLIVSNPPYIRKEELKTLNKEVLFDPIISLEGGKTGLLSYIKIARNISKYLKKEGFLVLEIGKGQLDPVDKIFFHSGFKRILKEKDLQGIDRIVVYKYNLQKNKYNNSF